MRLLLLYMLSMVVLGLISDQLDRRTYLLIGTAATGVTGLYLTVVRLM